MEKISWTDHVRNEDVLLRVNEQRNILHEIRKRKANWIGHILRRNCLIKQVIIITVFSSVINEYSCKSLRFQQAFLRLVLSFDSSTVWRKVIRRRCGARSSRCLAYKVSFMNRYSILFYNVSSFIRADHPTPPPTVLKMCPVAFLRMFLNIVMPVFIDWPPNSDFAASVLWEFSKLTNVVRDC
jgi:hypothetical protein